MNCQVGKEKFGKFIDLAIRILIVRCLKFDNSPNSQNFPTTTKHSCYTVLRGGWARGNQIFTITPKDCNVSSCKYALVIYLAPTAVYNTVTLTIAFVTMVTTYIYIYIYTHI